MGPAPGEFSGYSELFLPPCSSLCGLCPGGRRPEHPGRWEVADGQRVLSQTSTDWVWGVGTRHRGPEKVKCLAWIPDPRRGEVVLAPRLASLQGCRSESCPKQREQEESDGKS